MRFLPEFCFTFSDAALAPPPCTTSHLHKHRLYVSTWFPLAKWRLQTSRCAENRSYTANLYCGRPPDWIRSSSQNICLIGVWANQKGCNYFDSYQKPCLFIGKSICLGAACFFGGGFQCGTCIVWSHDDLIHAAPSTCTPNACSAYPDIIAVPRSFTFFSPMSIISSFFSGKLNKIDFFFLIFFQQTLIFDLYSMMTD